jgi:hypothetical protein
MRRIYLAGVAIVLAGCAAASAPATPRGELESARELWAAAGLDTYQFVFEDDCGECFLAEPRLIAVDNGLATNSEDPTVETLFDTIAVAITESSTVEVRYHPDLGHPIEIWIDREARAHDGGTHWLFRDLRP